MLRPSILAAPFFPTVPYNAIVTSDPSIGGTAVTPCGDAELRFFWGERNRAMGILSSP